MTVKEEIHRLVDSLSGDEEREVHEESEPLTDAEMARVRAGGEELERGEWIDQEELASKLGR